MATQDEVNRQHLAAAGLDPDSLGKPAPKADDPERCPFTQPEEPGGQPVRCALNKGHAGDHMRGKKRWPNIGEYPDYGNGQGFPPGTKQGCRSYGPSNNLRCIYVDGHSGDHLSGDGTALVERWPNTYKQREGDQPLPVINEHPDIQAAVISDIEARREVGISRYGTALQPNNGRDMLLDAYEEALDLAIYLKGVLVERDLAEAQKDA